MSGYVKFQGNFSNIIHEVPFYRKHELIPHVTLMLTPFSEYLIDCDRTCTLFERDTLECLDSVLVTEK